MQKQKMHHGLGNNQNTDTHVCVVLFYSFVAIRPILYTNIMFAMLCAHHRLYSFFYPCTFVFQMATEPIAAVLVVLSIVCFH